MTKQKAKSSNLSFNEKNKESSIKLKKSRKMSKLSKAVKSKSQISINDHLDIIKRSYVSAPEEKEDEIMLTDDNDESKSDEEVSIKSENENESDNKKEKNTGNEKPSRKNKYSLYLGNLVQSVTDVTLREFVQTVLSMKEIKICKVNLKKNGSSKGFAYLEVSDEKALKKALKLNGLKLKNQLVLVGRNDRVLDRIFVDVKNTVFINKIKAELTDGQIIQFLEKFIPVEEIVRFDRFKTNKAVPTGSLILEVASEEALEQIKKLDGHLLANKAICVKMYQTSLKNPDFRCKPDQPAKMKWNEKRKEISNNKK